MRVRQRGRFEGKKGSEKEMQLPPSHHLLAVFEDCHNYIYANEGLLKEKIFHEIAPSKMSYVPFWPMVKWIKLA